MNTDQSQKSLNMTNAISKKRFPKFKRLGNEKKKVLVKRKLALKYLSKKVDKRKYYPNMCRILDFIFPFDKELYANHLVVNEGEFQRDDYRIQVFSPIFNLFQYKRITKLTSNLEQNIFYFDMEERFPNSQIIKGFQNVELLTGFLDRVDNADALLLIFSIDNLMNFTTEIQKSYSLFEAKFSENYHNDKTEDLDNFFKFFKIDIPKAEYDQIFLSPFFMFTMR